MILLLQRTSAARDTGLSPARMRANSGGRDAGLSPARMRANSGGRDAGLSPARRRANSGGRDAGLSPARMRANGRRSSITTEDNTGGARGSPGTVPDKSRGDWASAFHSSLKESSGWKEVCP